MGSSGERWGEMGSGGQRWGEMGSCGQRWGVAEEASLAHPLLTSCCMARFLTSRSVVPVPVHGPGVGDPCPRRTLRSDPVQPKPPGSLILL